jgi:glucokinase
MSPRQMLPHPLLVADIGGTNCRIAVVDEPGARPRAVARVATDDPDLPTAGHALRRAISASGVAPRAAALAVAGPVIGRSAVLTNAGWSFDGPALAEALGLAQGLLVNDFEALAAALPELGADDLVAIKPGAAAEGVRLVLGPGTGFGAAALAGAKGRHVIMPTEAGHIELGPVGADEFALWPHLARVEGRVTIEALLSGSGLARLDAAMRAAAGGRALHSDGAAVQTAAAAGEAVAAAAVMLFGCLLARAAGDLALAFKATGGVFIAGGVAPRLAPLWDHAALARTFAAKPPMQALMADIALHLVTGADVAERGLAALACDPAAFGLADRLWR